MAERLNSSEKKGMHRYHLLLPQDTFNQLQDTAAARGVTVAALLRTFTRLGIDIMKAEETGGGLIIKRGDKKTELKIIW